MSSNKRGLGRGLGSLLGKTPNKVTQSKPSRTEQRYLPIESLRRGKYQPRQEIGPESLQELSQSIEEQGIIQPIIVRQIDEESYEIIAGERRWRAAQLANLRAVPVVIRKVSDKQAVAMALIENIQRENLNPIEEAQSLMRLIDEFSMTQQEAATAVGRSRPAVANLLRLLSLPAAVKEMLKNSELEMGHARALLSLPDTKQIQAAEHIKSRFLSVRAAESYVRSLLAPKERKFQQKTHDPNIVRLEHELADKLNAKVRLNSKAGGKGTIEISYNSLDELDGILAKIK